MAKFYRQVVERVAGQAAIKNGSFITAAYNQANKDFQTKQKRELLNDFDNHPVTKELIAGPNTESSYLSNGDLFSFIGFEDGENPTAPIREILEKETNLRKSSLGARYTPGRITYSFPVESPSIAEIENITPTPFQTSKSWVRMIERGANGLGYYIRKFLSKGETEDPGKLKYIEEKSMSGGGMQLKNDRQNPVTMPSRISYITEIYQKFKQRLNK